MAQSEENDNVIKKEKRRKLGELRSKNIDPYPHNFERTHLTEDLRKEFGHLGAGEKTESPVVRIAGRVMTVRQMGKASFFNIQDQSGTLQVYIKPKEIGGVAEESFGLLDLGDIVGVEGVMFATKTGELTLRAQKFEMLCKTLEPLPDKHSGLADVEIKYRRRYLDLITNPESRKVFETRSKVVREIRRFLDDRGFLEVETPILQPVYGGASATPFKTHHKTLDMTLYLKISPELYLKRLIVAGFEKVYDMSKNFRNEGIDRSHNPEFLMLEWYEAYTDYKYQMKQFEDLVSHVAEKVTGSTTVEYQGTKLEFAPPWKRMTMEEAIKEYGKLDPNDLSDQDLVAKVKSLGEDVEGQPSRGELMATLFELVAEKHLIQPTFILDYPEEVSPLTKAHREKKGLVERFEPYVCGMELGNAYTELNDPEDQRQRLQEQEKKRAEDEEAHPMDEEFVHAIEVGMPPTGGVGIGIGRLVMVLANQPSLRDVILFPTMRPQK